MSAGDEYLQRLIDDPYERERLLRLISTDQRLPYGERMRVAEELDLPPSERLSPGDLDLLGKLDPSKLISTWSPRDTYWAPSPRARELKKIVDDPRRSRKERLQAEQELGGIEAVAGRRDADKVRDAVANIGTPFGYDPIAEEESYPAGYTRALGPPECRTHRIRACSQCQPRAPRKTAGERFAELAREMDWDPVELRRPFAQGRRGASERERRAVLVSVVKRLSDERYTQGAIGEALGCGQRAVSRLLKG